MTQNCHTSCRFHRLCFIEVFSICLFPSCVQWWKSDCNFIPQHFITNNEKFEKQCRFFIFSFPWTKLNFFFHSAFVYLLSFDWLFVLSSWLFSAVFFSCVRVWVVWFLFIKKKTRCLKSMAPGDDWSPVDDCLCNWNTHWIVLTLFVYLHRKLAFLFGVHFKLCFRGVHSFSNVFWHMANRVK